MKYCCEVEINLPIHKAAELFNNPDNLAQWQPGFISYERIFGDTGQLGTKTKYKYKIKELNLEVIEIITQSNLPFEIHSNCQMDGIYSEQRIFFKEISFDKTKLTMECESKLPVILKFFVWFTRGSAKKKAQEHLDLFKIFAERKKNNKS